MIITVSVRCMLGSWLMSVTPWELITTWLASISWFGQRHSYIFPLMLERLSKYVWNIEEFWIEAKDFLEQSGYRIPPRFDLDYVPSSRYEELSAETKMPVKQLLSFLYPSIWIHLEITPSRSYTTSRSGPCYHQESTTARGGRRHISLKPTWRPKESYCPYLRCSSIQILVSLDHATAQAVLQALFWYGRRGPRMFSSIIWGITSLSCFFVHNVDTGLDF